MALLSSVLIVGALFGAGAFPGTAQGPSGQAPGYEPAAERVEVPAEQAAQDVIVRFRGGTDAAERAEARQRAGARLEQTLPVPGLQVVDPRAGVSVEQAVARLERSEDVLYAEPDVARSATVTPNDRLFPYLWGLHNTGQTIAGSGGTVDADIDAPEAWNETTGVAGTTVGVIDTGVDYDHPDLAPNDWRNPGETGSGREANGVDDDGNGLVDDWRGWDWVDADNSPKDLNGHGTHVAGTAAARGNDGTGVAGVSWNTRVLPLRVLGADGSGRVSDAVAAYAYAGRKGIRIVNASLGGSEFSRAEYDAIAAAPETLFVVAAGNEGADNDAVGSFPCNHPLPNVVCVAASDRNDALASFSNYGARNVDLAAPGVDIVSTWLNGEWVLLDGTSMATPHVAGAAALVWSRQPGASVADVRAAILRNVDPRSALSGRTASGGRLNAFRAVSSVSAASAPATAAPSPAAPSTEVESATAPSSPAPAPAPSTGEDTTPPSLRVSIVSSRQRISTVLRRGIRTRSTCSETCTLRHRVVISRRTAKRLRLGSGARAVVIATARSGRTGAGSKVVYVKFRSSRVRGALRRSRSVTVRLRSRATDAAGNRSKTSSRRIRLVR